MMEVILDASATLAWLINRENSFEEQLAMKILQGVEAQEAIVPALWFSEVANGILIAERRGGASPAQTTHFMKLVEVLPINLDRASLSATQGTILMLARIYGLTSYDATYLELVLRTGATLATFDRQLADAVHKAGGRIFGDSK